MYFVFNLTSSRLFHPLTMIQYSFGISLITIPQVAAYAVHVYRWMERQFNPTLDLPPVCIILHMHRYLIVDFISIIKYIGNKNITFICSI